MSSGESPIWNHGPYNQRCAELLVETTVGLPLPHFWSVEENEERIAMLVCQLVPTMTLTVWNTLSPPKRVPWLEQAIKELPKTLAAIAPDKIGTPAPRQHSDFGKASLDAMAVAVFIDHPEWTKKKIANHLGKHEKSLAPTRCPKLDAAIKAYKAKPPTVRGSKDSEGNVEAWDDED
jgi:hypothetical protein